MATAKSRNEQFIGYLKRLKSSYEAMAGVREHSQDVRGYFYDLGRADAAETILKRFCEIMKGRK